VHNAPNMQHQMTNASCLPQANVIKGSEVREGERGGEGIGCSVVTLSFWLCTSDLFAALFARTVSSIQYTVVRPVTCGE
jgi:hypothetical protein